MKNNKGITIIVLVLTIVIALILTSVVLNFVDPGTEAEKYNAMCADIELLENKILIYYNKYSELPISNNLINNAQTIIGDQISQNDIGDYYTIDLTKIENMSLNYGKGVSETDIYIINEGSHKVYYLKGVTYQGKIYYAK